MYVYYTFLLWLTHWTRSSARGSLPCTPLAISDPRALPLVDIFFIVSDFQDRAYIKKGMFWAVPLTAALQAASPNVRIHLFTDMPNSQSSLRHLYPSAAVPNLFFHDTRLYAAEAAAFLHRYKDFHSHYQYKLDPTYDSFCFFRWIIYSHAVEQWNAPSSIERKNRELPIERVLALDLDVLFTTDPSLFYHAVMHHAVSDAHNDNSTSSRQLRFVSATLGAVALFTRPGLQELAAFVHSFYFNQTDGEVRRVHASYGRYFTDMMLMKEFALRDVSTRDTASFDYTSTSTSTSSGTGYKSWRLLGANQCLLRRLGCIPMSNYRGMLDRLAFYHNKRLVRTYSCASLRGRALTLRNADESLPFCYIHFQGREHKEVLYGYAKAVELALLGCDAVQQRGDNQTLVVQIPHKGKQLHAVQGGHRRALSWRAYLALNTSAVNTNGATNSTSSGGETGRFIGTATSIPVEVLDFFPRAPPSP